MIPKKAVQLFHFSLLYTQYFTFGPNLQGVPMYVLCVGLTQWNLIALTDAPAQVSHTNKLMKDFLFSLLSGTELSFGIFF